MALDVIVLIETVLVAGALFLGGFYVARGRRDLALAAVLVYVAAVAAFYGTDAWLRAEQTVRAYLWARLAFTSIAPFLAIAMACAIAGLPDERNKVRRSPSWTALVLAPPVLATVIMVVVPFLDTARFVSEGYDELDAVVSLVFFAYPAVAAFVVARRIPRFSYPLRRRAVLFLLPALTGFSVLIGPDFLLLGGDAVALFTGLALLAVLPLALVGLAAGLDGGRLAGREAMVLGGSYLLATALGAASALVPEDQQEASFALQLAWQFGALAMMGSALLTGGMNRPRRLAAPPPPPGGPPPGGP